MRTSTKPYRIVIRWSALFAVPFLLLALVGCGAESTAPPPGAGEGADAAPLKVITTVSPITSIVENIGGARIDLEGVVPEGVNSHTFEPAPSVSRLLAEADLIVLNGLFLEEPTLELAKAGKRSDAVILSLGERTVTREEWRFDFSFPSPAGIPTPTCGRTRFSASGTPSWSGTSWCGWTRGTRPTTARTTTPSRHA